MKVGEDSKNFNWKGIDFSVSLTQINKFDGQNKYAINVFGFENGKNLKQLTCC